MGRWGEVWTIGPEVGLADILQERESRQERQKRMLRQGCALICFTMNMPGPVKTTALSQNAFLWGCSRIQDALLQAGIQVMQREHYCSSCGQEAYILAAGNPNLVKKIAISIEEEHGVGRLFDIDVLDETGNKLSREESNHPARFCLICRREAFLCARSRTHTVLELQTAAAKLLLAFAKSRGVTRELVESIGWMASVLEAYTSPKPGLVDRNNNGSHMDMDLMLFERSAQALRPYWGKCWQYGFEHSMLEPESMLGGLRPLGIQAEQTMLEATDGINTHKGLIYSLGILCAGLGVLLRRDMYSRQEWFRIAGRIADSGVVNPAWKKEQSKLTHGERMCRDYGILGVRGEAAKGFPSVRLVGLPILEQELKVGLSWEEAGVTALLHLISQVQDTNMYARGGAKLAQELSGCVREYLDRTDKIDIKWVEALDRRFIAKHVSPGGCADLLALSYFVLLAETFTKQ